MKHIVDIETQRRTNSQIGALIFVCGLLSFAFAAFGTFVISLQAIVVQILPLPTSARERQFFDVMSSVHSLMLLLMPTMALLGCLLAASGWYVRRGSAAAIRVARWTLLGALGWGFAYMVHVGTMLLDPRMSQDMTDIPAPLEPFRPVIYTVQGVFALGVLFGPPALLLFLLRRTRSLEKVGADLAGPAH